MAKVLVENSTQSQHKGSQCLNRSDKMYEIKVKPWDARGGGGGGGVWGEGEEKEIIFQNLQRGKKIII